MIVYISFFRSNQLVKDKTVVLGRSKLTLHLIGPEQKIIWRKTELEYALDPQE